MGNSDKHYATGPAHGNYTRGHTIAGQRHRLGYVSHEMWLRLVAQCDTLGISANEGTIRAIEAWLNKAD